MAQRTKRAAGYEENKNQSASYGGERTQNKSVPSGQGRNNIDKKLEELEAEWSYEKIAKVAAAGVVILGVFLSVKNRRKIEEFGRSMAQMLGVESLAQWTPPPVLLEKVGLRTQTEIEQDIQSLYGDE